MANASLIGSYSAPPVVEAVVQFVLAEPLDEAEFRKTSNRMKREYSTYEELESVNANVNFESRTAEFSSVPNRKMTSEDQADTFSMSMESFAWSRLAPYEGWGSFLGRLISNYEAIKAILGYRKLSRVGVRYINRIDVPTNEIEDVIPYEDYLAIHLNLPPEIYKLRNYAWRLECSIDGFTAIAQSASIEPVIPDMGSFLLDLDIVAINDIPPKFEGVIDLLNRMRKAKNRMFEMSITDKARESFSA